MGEIAKQAQVEAAEKGNATNKSALRETRMLALVIPLAKRERSEAPVAKGDEPGKSQAVTEDPWEALAADGEIIEPPFDLFTLAMLNEHSTELTPIVDTMETNIDGFGYHLRCRLSGKDLENKKKDVRAEYVRLTNFFNNANLRDSFTKLRRKRRRDLEMTGNAYWEVIRSAGNKIQGFEHLPSYQLRLSRLDKEAIKIKVPVLELQEDGSYAVTEIQAWHRFRRYVQARIVPFSGMGVSEGGMVRRWFKEYGDPRVVDNQTGKVVEPEDVENWDNKGEQMPESRRANEVVHWDLYSTRSPYGLPRYIGNLLSIYGARAAEEINYVTFRNNNIPSMLILASNGQITQGSIERIESFVESAIQGSDNYSKFLIVEAEGDLEGEDPGNVKLEVKPLTSDQIHDALFQKYTRNCQVAIRRAYRIPPIFVGACHSEDTEFLTEHGWRHFAEVADGVRVATYNKGSGALELQLPTSRHEYDWDGPVLHLKNRGIDALVTPHHRFWTRPTSVKNRVEKPWRMVEGHHLAGVRGGNSGHLELPVSASWEAERVDTFTIPASPRTNAWNPSKVTKNPARDLARYERAKTKSAPRNVSMHQFLRFLGYFVSEGSTTDVRGPITLSQNAGPIADAMLAVLRELEFEPSVTESRLGQLKIDVCHGGLWEWLRQHCGTHSDDKRLPRFVFSLATGQLEILLGAMIDGDGSLPKRGTDGSFEYPTTSRQLNADLHELCVRLGIALTTHVVRGEERGRKDLFASYGHNHRVHLIHPEKHIKELHYKGKVACFHVPNDTLVTRREGRVLIAGNTDDYSRATAETSRRLGDEQVFAPERDEFDDFVNRRLLPVMEAKYHVFKSNSPNTTDNSELVRILSGAEKTGGMTPRIARQVLEDILGIDLPPFTADFDPDTPFSLTMAQAVKNQADPTEPGQQVTALKSMMGWGDNEVGEEALALAEVLREEIEKLWRWKGEHTKE